MFCSAPSFPAALVVEQLALFERLLDGVLEIFEVCSFHSLKGMYWIVEAASQEEIGQRLQQILGVDAEIFAGVFGVLDLFTKPI
jgi:hypothetical protein